MKKIIICLTILIIGIISGIMIAANNIKMAHIECDEDGLMIYYTILGEEFSYYFEC